MVRKLMDTLRALMGKTSTRTDVTSDEERDREVKAREDLEQRLRILQAKVEGRR